MRIVKENTTGLPKRNWKKLDENIVDELNIYITWNARSCVKVLFFKNLKTMRKFWKNNIGGHLENGFRGVTNELGYDKVKFEKDGSEKSTRIVDKNFFSVMGLTLDKLCVESIMHESIHAGYSYQRRTINSRKKWPGEIDMPEERVCYSASRIAYTIMQHLINKNIKIPLVYNKKKPK